MTDCDCQVTLDSRLSTQSRPRDCTASVVRRSSRRSLSHQLARRTPTVAAAAPHGPPRSAPHGCGRERSSRCLSATSSACQRLSCHDLACHRSAHHHAPWHALLHMRHAALVRSISTPSPRHLRAIFAPSRTHRTQSIAPPITITTSSPLPSSRPAPTSPLPRAPRIGTIALACEAPSETLVT